MDTERILETNRSIASSNPLLFHSVGGHLAKHLGLSEYNNSEMGISRIQPESTRSHIKHTKEFLPFMNERDTMNRLLTVANKYDPTKLEESSNPSFYYKSERFDRKKLLLIQANRTKFALGKLLYFKTEEDDKSRILEAIKELDKRKEHREVGKLTPKFAGWIKNENNQSIEISEDKKMITKEPFEPEIQNTTVTNGANSISASMLVNIQGVKTRQKPSTVKQNRVVQPLPSAESSRTMTKNKSLKDLRNKKIFTKNDNFCEFYQKLDLDIRDIATSSHALRKKTQENLNNLFNVFKKFEVKKDALKLEDLRVMSPNDISKRTVRIRGGKSEISYASPNIFQQPGKSKNMLSLEPINSQRLIKKKNLSVGTSTFKTFRS